MNDNRIINAHPFVALTPDFIADAVESVGYVTDGRLLALNSYENRVYQIGIADSQPLVVKFYRPQRWTQNALAEEHAFALELAAADIPVVAPIATQGVTLHRASQFWFALYPRQGGHWPELQTAEERRWMGRFLGRIHAIGRRLQFEHRAELNINDWGVRSCEFLLQDNWIPAHLINAYESIAEDLLERMTDRWDSMSATSIRLHGDCHLGNVLWTDGGPHFVDLDDCMMGPAIQDMWMLLSGSHSEQSQQLQEILDGYTQFANFDPTELALIEILRTLRIMNYAAWLARRWQDPAFPNAFPWFGENKFWEQHVLDLREQLAALDEPALQ